MNDPPTVPADANDPGRGAGHEDLVAYLDGELPDQAADAMHTRLGQEPTLRVEADALTQTWDLLDYLPRPQPSPHFTERTVQRLETAGYVLRLRGERWRTVALVGWLSVLILAGVLSFLLAFYWPSRQQQAHAVAEEPAPTAPVPSPAPVDVFPELRGPAGGPGPGMGGRPAAERQLDRAMAWLRIEMLRLERELMPKLTKAESAFLREKRQAGGLEYLDTLLELAKTHGVPLRNPNAPPPPPLRPMPSPPSNRPGAPAPP
ncbi:MAG TPA: hypothetical protein PKD86_08205 [Gemmatales bacterium]|nr:hypothetical protein [Gemmatales bacterium]